MSFNFSFRFADDEKDIMKVAEFLGRQPWGYPHYMDWVQRTREELLSGWKRSILALSDGISVGNLVFQPHKDFPAYFLELKNMRVHPKLQGRYFGVFMLRQAEVEGRRNYQGAICDTHSANLPVINLLNFMGYRELFRAPIYRGDSEEVILGKTFGRTARGIFTTVQKKILERCV